MDLKSLDQIYKKFSNPEELKKVDQKLDILAQELRESLKKKAILIAAKPYEPYEKQAEIEDSINFLDGEITALQEKLLGMQECISQARTNLRLYTEKLKETPALNQKITEVLEKRYARDMKEHEKEKEGYEEKQSQYVLLDKALDRFPELNNNLTLIQANKMKIEKIKAHYKVGPDGKMPEFIDSDKQEIAKLTVEIEIYQKEIFNKLRSKNIQVPMECIESVDSRKDISKNITMYSKKIQRVDIRIQDKQKAMELAKMDLIEKEKESEETRSLPPAKVGFWTNMWGKIKGRAQKLFGKKGKDISADNAPEVDSSENASPVGDIEDSKNFRDALKYDIVKQRVDTLEKEYLQQATSERKEAIKQDKEENTER